VQAVVVLDFIQAPLLPDLLQVVARLPVLAEHQDLILADTVAGGMHMQEVAAAPQAIVAMAAMLALQPQTLMVKQVTQVLAVVEVEVGQVDQLKPPAEVVEHM
jgi:hypothetical protein